MDKQQKEQGELFQANEAQEETRRDRRRSIRPLARQVTANLTAVKLTAIMPKAPPGPIPSSRVSPADAASVEEDPTASSPDPAAATSTTETKVPEAPEVGNELVAGISRRLVTALQSWHDKSDTIATMHRLMEHVSFHQVWP